MLGPDHVKSDGHRLMATSKWETILTPKWVDKELDWRESWSGPTFGDQERAGPKAGLHKLVLSLWKIS